MNGRQRRRHRVAAVVEDPGLDAGSLTGLVAGPLTRLGSIIAEVRPDRIVIALADRRGRLPMTDLLMARVNGVVVEEGADCYERLTGKIAIEALTPGALIASRDFRKTHLDLAFGRACSLLAAVDRAGRPGAAVRGHRRSPSSSTRRARCCSSRTAPACGGRRIRLLKFRTMRPAAGPTSEWEQDNGDRITRVGRWLRGYRLDELPQLVNVLRGDLNLVGPRPHPMSNVELFSREIPYYALRSVVRPGLTGWAQVRQGYANSLEEETEKMRYDLYYIKHMSAWLDLRILFETIHTVLAGPRRAARAGTTARVAWWRPTRTRPVRGVAA